MVENSEEKKEEPKKKSQDELMMDKFDAKKHELSQQMLAAAAAFKKTETLRNAEHILYTVRQNLVDYKHELSLAISRINKSYKGLKEDRMMAWKSNKVNIVPANADEKKIADAKFFRSVVEMLEKFDAQLDWTKDSIAGCDQMSNGLSYYIKLAQLAGN